MSCLNSARAWCQDFENIWMQEKSQKSFAQVAYAHFSQRPWHEGFDLLSVLNEFLDKPAGKQQNAGSNFGTPPLTIFASQNQDFYLNLYIWHEAHTSIHEHAFQGAFCVLQGSSLESRYRFTRSKDLGTGSSLGKLEGLEARLIKPGNTVLIPAGAQLIHRVIHLENPTVSLILRTKKENDHQKSYTFECLESPSHPAGEALVKLRVLEWLLNNHQPVDETVVRELSGQHQTWLMLFRNPETFSMAKKISVDLSGLDLLLGQQKHFGFQKSLSVLQRPEQKLLLCLIEQFHAQGLQVYERLTHSNAKPVLREVQATISELRDNSFIKTVLDLTC